MDTVSKEKRSEIMSRIRSTRTGPEIKLHNYLKGWKVRHRYQPRGLHGRPDFLVYPNVAVFVNGCFWHGCARHYREPKSNVAFWRAKIARNAERHSSVSRRLRREGYSVITIWEHEIKNLR